LLVELRAHLDQDVRLSVATGLGGHDAPEAIGALIELTRDSDDEVRDWATFSLGTQCDADGENIRTALLDRVSDSFLDVREEAIAGLCKRKDPRGASAILKFLEAEPLTELVAEAADQLLGLGKDAPDWDSEQYAAAIRARFATN
jgi:HEAT repeat protein